jgi:hypothetical protein
MIAKIAFILRLTNFFDCKKGGWGGKKNFWQSSGAARF